MTKKLRIGVLLGGRSIEREVSLSSGRTICDHTDTTLYDVLPLFQTEENKLYILPWRFLHRGKISDFEHRLAAEAEEIAWDDLQVRVDFVWIAQHGRYGEDGCAQAFLELLKIPYFGSGVLASALGMDKVLQKKFLRNAGVIIPKDCLVTPREIRHYQENPALLKERLLAAGLAYPMVVKPVNEGSSLGVSVVFTEEELFPALVKACTVTKDLVQSVLIEERITGMEFTCVIINDPKKADPVRFPITEVLYEKGYFLHGYEQKYMPGRSLKFTPARCSDDAAEAIYQVSLKTMQVLGFSTMGRIDGFLKEDGSVVIIDPNSLCGMAPSGFFFTQAAQVGMSHTDVINYLLSLELERYGLQMNNVVDKTHSRVSQKIRVGVLLGGPSNEKEVSLDSGRNICYKLSPHKYEVVPLFMDKESDLYQISQKELVCNATAEIEYKLDRTKKVRWHDLPKLVDFVFIGLHGAPGENGVVQGTLEMLGLPYNGSGIAASALCMDKFKTNAFLRSQGFDVPFSLLLTKDEWNGVCPEVQARSSHFVEDDINAPSDGSCSDRVSGVQASQSTLTKEEIMTSLLQQCGLPAIVKPHDDGCSVMVQKATTGEELELAIERVFASGKTVVMIEEFIVGMELTVGVVGNDNPKALPPSQAISSGAILSIEEKFLPGAGENQTPAPLSPEATAFVQKTMEEVYAAIGCSGYARIDCFYQTAEQSRTGKPRTIPLEVNSLPGMTPATCIFHQAAEIGMKPMDFVDLIVTLGFEKHRKQNTEETIFSLTNKESQEQNFLQGHGS